MGPGTLLAASAGYVMLALAGRPVVALCVPQLPPVWQEPPGGSESPETPGGMAGSWGGKEASLETSLCFVVCSQ